MVWNYNITHKVKIYAREASKVMSFNAQHVRTMRTAKNTQARVSKYSGGGKTPFVEPRNLDNGSYRIRLWPADGTKNPLGYLYYRSHKLIDSDGNPPIGWCCPRSSNWDPLPLSWEDEEGNVIDPELVDPEIHFPVYKERCWACEIEQQLADLGIELDQCSPRLAKWLGALLGDSKYHFPATITAEVTGKEVQKNEETGKEYTIYSYGPASDERLHCIFSLKDDSSLAKTLLDLLEECPDCSDMMFGRWLVLTKSNEGKGTGGYTLRFEVKPSPAGFELSNYPNLSNWGKGNAQYKKPSKRLSYDMVESVGAAPGKWWIPELVKLGLILSDADAEDAPF